MPGRAGILFDVGYCLMDEHRRLAHALEWLAEALTRARHPRSEAELHSAYRAACRQPARGEPSLLVQMLRSLAIPAETTAALRRAVPWDRVPLEAYPETVPALQSLRTAGFRLGILANQPRSARTDLDGAGIAPLCDGVWLSEAVGFAKPDPAFFQLALDAWALPPDRVAYVGDRPDNDVAPAKRLGMATVRLCRGPHADQLPRTDAERADIEVRDLAQAVRHLVAWHASLRERPA